MDINLAMKRCFDKGYIVYPICDNWKWYIEVNINGKIKRYPKPVQQKDINESVSKTIIFYAEKYEKTKTRR